MHYSIIRQWLPLALITTLICGLVYVIAQQNYRTSANDPQIQMAEDAALALAGGAKPFDLIPNTPTDLQNSLAPYLIVFDTQGVAVASSATVHGEKVSLPKGIFDYVRAHGEDRITWQPQKDIRSAAVILEVQGSNPGFVLAGRSLREIELRENSLLLQVFFSWIFTLIALFITLFFVKPRERNEAPAQVSFRHSTETTHPTYKIE